MTAAQGRPFWQRKSLAEMTAEEKNKLSHRGRALRAIRARLLELL